MVPSRRPSMALAAIDERPRHASQARLPATCDPNRLYSSTTRMNHLMHAVLVEKARPCGQNIEPSWSLSTPLDHHPLAVSVMTSRHWTDSTSGYVDTCLIPASKPLDSISPKRRQSSRGGRFFARIATRARPQLASSLSRGVPLTIALTIRGAGSSSIHLPITSAGPAILAWLRRPNLRIYSSSARYASLMALLLSLLAPLLTTLVVPIL